MTSHNPTTPQELLEQIRHFIAVSKTHVDEGGEVELSGLDEKVQELCTRVLDMPKSEADAYSASLQQLAQELDELKQGMERAQQEVKRQLDALNLRHKAAKAYTTAPVTTPKKP